MTLIADIRKKFIRDEFEFAKHATDRLLLRGISVQEIREVIGRGEIIEEYPDDKYGPSCLIFGFTDEGVPLHVQCSYPSRPIIKVITLYEPDSQEWDNYRMRKG